MNEQELLNQFLGLDTSRQQVIKLVEPENEQITHAKSHCGFISASHVATLATYQPDHQVIAALELEIEELDYQISTSTRGTKAAEKSRESKKKQLDRMVNDDLPEGAVTWAEEIAMMRLTGFCEESDVSFGNKATRWGNAKEAFAVETLKSRYPALDFRATCEDQEFILMDGFEKVGATPDSLVYERRYIDYRKFVLDIKCPFNRRIHGIDYKNIQSFAQFKRDYPLYYWQATLQMMCAKVDKFMFASFDPRQTAPNDLFVHHFDLVQADADFLLSRITKAELMIESILEQFN
jgi:hypothetical protein